jgi:hypothetical protein
VARQRTVLFGGLGASGYNNDTWEWDGVNWTLRTLPQSPTARYETSLVYDPARERCVLTGGWGSGGAVADVWEYDGNTWTPRATATTPAARSGHAAAFDVERGRMLMFGGEFASGSLTSQTWSYGLTDPAAFTTFGNGCPGSAGTPVLAPSGQSLPWLGSSFTMTVSGMAATGLGAGCLGLSRLQWQGTPLPLSLAAVGMPGCSLRVSPEVLFVVFGGGGSAPWTLNIPNQPVFLGASLFAQAAVVDPGANALGLTMSNAAELLCGGL